MVYQKKLNTLLSFKTYLNRERKKSLNISIMAEENIRYCIQG